MTFDEGKPDDIRLAEADYALAQIDEGKATGDRRVLRFRRGVETSFSRFGEEIGRRPIVALVLVLAACALCTLGFLRARFETDELELWAEKGGRLEDELAYTAAQLGTHSSSSNEILIQEAKEGENAISREALDEHLAVIDFVAKSVNVTKWGRQWSYRDLCFAVKPPPTTVSSLDDVIFGKMNPCVVLSVMDCFWEGSFIHNPASPLNISVDGSDYRRSVNWSSLNPHELIDELSNADNPLDDGIRTGLESAGFDGYVFKPCLHPENHKCPSTAPEMDIKGALLTGCKGYASAAMIWPSQILVAGTDWKTRGSSKAVQAIFRLHSIDEILERLTRKFGNDWEPTTDDAIELLKEWRKEFSKRVYEFEENLQRTVVHVWTTDSATDVVEQFSTGSPALLALGYLLMIVYAGFVFLNIKSFVLSRVNVGVVGVILVMISTLAALGFSSLCGIALNPTSTQVLPFLVLGLGVDDMFVMAHAFFATYRDRANVPVYRITGECLKRVGQSITLTSVTNGAGFLLAAIVPIPAMRAFAIQVGICVIFNYFVLLLAFPAYLSIDAYRSRQRLCDVFCCFRIVQQDKNFNGVAVAKGTTTTNGASRVPSSSPPPPPSNAETSVPVTTLIGARVDEERGPHSEAKASCSWENFGDSFVNFYSPLLQNLAVKFTVLALGLALLGVGIWGATNVKNGLDLVEVVPSGTRQHGFVEASLKHFTFYDMYIALDDRNDIPRKQKELLEFHQKFASVPYILTKDAPPTADGKVVKQVSEDFWLQKMIVFYDLFMEQYVNASAEEKSLLESFTVLLMDHFLLGQVGNGSYDAALVSEPNRSVISQVDGVKVIPEERYDIYLTAWVNMDILNYETAQPNFRPLIPTWIPATTLNIAPAPAATYAQMPMYADGLATSFDFIELIKQTRAICEAAEADGIYAYPRGSPFTFYEQYIGLQNSLLLAVGLILLACFLATSLLLLSAWTGVVMVVMLTTIAVEVYGFLGLAGIQFSAIPCVTVIVSVGAAVEFTAPLCLMFLKSTGSGNQRMHCALFYRFVPIFNGAFSSFLGFIMLAFSQFDFIVKYFFLIFIALLITGVFNGLIVLPVVLSLVGPPPQVEVIDKPIAKGSTDSPGPSLSMHSLSVHSQLSGRLATHEGTPV